MDNPQRRHDISDEVVSGRKYDLRLPKQSADEAAPCGSAAAGGGSGRLSPAVEALRGAGSPPMQG